VDEVTPQQSTPRAAALASRPSASGPVSSDLGTTPTVVARGSAVSAPEASTPGAKLRGTLTASIAGAIAALVVVYLALPREAGAPVREPADRTPTNGLEPPPAPRLAAGAQQTISKHASSEARPAAAVDAREPAPDPVAGRAPEEVTPRASRPTAAPPTVPTARVTAKASARRAIPPAAPTRDCDPPYVVDNNGFKRFRIECVESGK
jgi:serine/threonine-protein kinase